MNQDKHSMSVDPNTLTFSPWNVNSVSPENQQKLVESIRRNGLFRPVVVRELDDGTLQVIAGEHTTLAAIELKYARIDVYNLGKLDDIKAKEISIIDNQHYGHEDAFGLAELLKQLEGDVEAFLPMSDANLKAIFKATSVDLDTLELPDTSGLPVTHPDDELAVAPVTSVFMKFRVPIGDNEFVQRCIEAVMKRQGFTGADSLANAGDALVYICNNWNK